MKFKKTLKHNLAKATEITRNHYSIPIEDYIEFKDKDTDGYFFEDGVGDTDVFVKDGDRKIKFTFVRGTK